MASVFAKLVGLALLIAVNGVFAMAEIAVVAARKPRLREKAASGDARAALVLQLVDSPNQFLSTVQVGVTLVGILSGLVGGVAFSGDLALLLARVPWLAPYSGALSYVLVVAVITYLSVVFGELVPKRVALANPDGVATALATPMRYFQTLANPIVELLAASTRGVTRLLGIEASFEPPVTDEEIRALIEEGTEAGIFEEAEEDMVKGILLLGDRKASAIMTPRPDIVWLDIADTPEEILSKLERRSYSRFPVANGSLDEILGAVHAKDMLINILKGNPLELGPLLYQPLYVPEIMPVLRVLEAFREAGTEMALVINEYGSVEGLVTLSDIMEAIVGEIPSAEEMQEPEAIRREDGSWLVDGLLPIDELKEILGLEEPLPSEEEGLYQTVAGFVIMQLGRVPNIADHFEYGGMRFEVMDMIGPRVNRVLISFLPQPEPPELHEDVEDF